MKLANKSQLATDDIMDVLYSYKKYLTAWLEGRTRPLLENKEVVKSLKKAMSSVSTFNGPIYRGLTIRDDRVADLLNNKEINLAHQSLESWSANPRIALAFSRDASDKNHTGVMISKKRLKKETIVVDFTSKEVMAAVKREAAYSFVHWVISQAEVEKELVVMPQCVKCTRKDVELIWVQRDSTKLIDMLKIHHNQFKYKSQVAVAIRGKKRHRVLPQDMRKYMDWRRKPSKHGL